MGWDEGATFIFLTTCALTTQEVGECTFDTGALDRLVDIETDVFFGGELDSFLIMIDAKLRMMKFSSTVDLHHGASIASFDVMNVISGIVVVGGFELFFVIIDKANGFMVADEFDMVLFGVGSDGFKIKIGRSNGEFIVDAVF